MVWYYADSDRQRGPISDEEFQEMIANGRVRPETLIWKDGMDNWLPLENARDAGLIPFDPPPTQTTPPIPAATPSAPGQPVTCTQCGASPLTSWNSVQLGNLNLCHKCDTQLARYYQERNQPTPIPDAPTSGHPDPQAPSIETASIFERAGAVVIDSLIIGIISTIIMNMMIDRDALTQASTIFWSGDINKVADLLGPLMRPILIARLVFEFLYHFALVATCGGSIGKLIFKIRVTGPNGEPATLQQAFRRAFLPLLLMLPFCIIPTSSLALLLNLFYYCGFPIALYDPHHRTLYDLFARTRVIRNY